MTPKPAIPSDPAEALRNIFLNNDGKVTSNDFDAKFLKMTSTYGWEVYRALYELLRDGVVVKNVNAWVWPTIYVAMSL